LLEDAYLIESKKYFEGRVDSFREVQVICELIAKGYYPEK
jgi:hypothetical protein